MDSGAREVAVPGRGCCKMSPDAVALVWKVLSSSLGMSNAGGGDRLQHLPGFLLDPSLT